jgi:UDP-N-acetylglucosamine 1-carboxyvinyltransferase
MATYKITGGVPLKGEVFPEPNKNSILKIIPAAVLTDEPVVLHNVPKSSAVRVMLQVFKQLGGKVSYLKEGTIKLNASTINTFKIDDKLAAKEKSSFVFLGPLLSRFGEAEIKEGGGCKLGNRPLDAMFQGLLNLGVKLDRENGYRVSTTGLKGCESIWLIEASVTGTENLILAAVKAKGRTIIYNAACEPHTQDLCNFLVSIGAKIQGIGSNKLIIDGVESLSGGEWTIINDHIDIGGLIVAAVVTKGELLIRDAIPEHMGQILNYFEKCNVKVEIRGKDIFVPGNQKLVSKRNLKGNIDKINDWAWPAYPVDLIPQALVLALASDGNMRVYSNMYETQLMFFEQLVALGGNMIMANPHQIITFGPSKFRGARVVAPNIIQGVHSIILAALAAEGTTIIENADMILRRFPNLVTNLTKLGARIEKV